MRSLVMSMFLFTSAVSAALGEAFVCASSFLLLLLCVTLIKCESSLVGSIARLELRHQRNPCGRWWNPVLDRRSEA